MRDISQERFVVFRNSFEYTEEKGKEELNRKFAQLQSWADMYDSCDLEAREMIKCDAIMSWTSP